MIQTDEERGLHYIGELFKKSAIYLAIVVGLYLFDWFFQYILIAYFYTPTSDFLFLEIVMIITNLTRVGLIAIIILNIYKVGEKLIQLPKQNKDNLN